MRAGIVELAPLRAQRRDTVALAPHLAAQLGETLGLHRGIELDAIDVSRREHQRADHHEIDNAQDHARPRMTEASEGSRGSSSFDGVGTRRGTGALGGAQLRRTGARVGRDLGFVRGFRPAREHAERRRRGSDLRPMPRGSRGAASLHQEVLDDAILERVKGDDDQPPGGLEYALGGGEAARQFGKLVVDENPQRLEGPRRRMDHAFARAHHACDDVGERARRADRPLVARLGDRARDGPRLVLFAERGDDGGELALARGGDDIGGARAVAAHAHIERPVEPEGKAARGFIELHRRNAEVEDDAIGRCRIAAGDNGFQIGEAIFDQLEPALRLAH